MSKPTPAPAQVAPQPAPLAQRLTIKQVASLLGVHRTTVYDLIHHAGLSVMHLGPRSTRINAAKLHQWLAEREACDDLTS